MESGSLWSNKPSYSKVRELLRKYWSRGEYEGEVPEMKGNGILAQDNQSLL